MRFLTKHILFSTFVALVFCVSSEASATSKTIRKAMNLTTYQTLGFTVDATAQGTRVRETFLRLKELGFNHITFNVRAKMVTGHGSEVDSFVPLAEQAIEEQLLEETIGYAHKLGFTTGLRPIVLVVGPRGEFPYTKDGLTWWHGLIEPQDPARWFLTFQKFHSRYLALARRQGIAQYTIGAELHSMTTGLGERRPARPRGYPAKWTELINFAKSILGARTRVVYDFNYTDQAVFENGIKRLGGEFEQLRWDTTRPASKPDDVRFQLALREFYKSLDAIGIDMYRPLATTIARLPRDQAGLAAALKPRADSYATQLDTSLLEIQAVTDSEKEVDLKEVGYRSVEGSFINPAAYESAGGRFSMLHQAAAWEALLGAFYSPGWPWFGGVHVWDTNVDFAFDTKRNLGFTPIGKSDSEQVFLRFFTDRP